MNIYYDLFFNWQTERKTVLEHLTNPLDGRNTKKPNTKTADFFVNTHISVKFFQKSQNN